MSSGTTYEIDIALTAGTLPKLRQQNYNLYGFKAVQASQGGGAPLVWFQVASADLLPTIKLTWTEQYQAYISNDSIISNGQITASLAVDINLGQTLNLDPDGTSDVTTEGPSQAISIYNGVPKAYTSGISQATPGGSPSPMCAFPLDGMNVDVIVPIETVLLMFSTQPVDTGTVIEQAYGPGILVDLTSANTRSVAYDVNAAWSWGNYGWATQVKPNENLVPLLIP